MDLANALDNAELMQKVYAISIAINALDGGIKEALAVNGFPDDHEHANHEDSYYFNQIDEELTKLNYINTQYSMRVCEPNAKTRAEAILDARTLRTNPALTWMACPNIIISIQVIEFSPLSFAKI